MPDLVSFSTAGVTLEGRLFEGDAAVRMKNALAKEVTRLAEDTKRKVVSGIKTRNGTGFTAANVEVHQRPANSLYATIRLKPELERPPGSTLYPASRRAYIVNAVLESGRYGGSYTRTIKVNAKTGRARVRKTWQSGARRRRPLLMWRNAGFAARRQAATIRADLVARELA